MRPRRITTRLPAAQPRKPLRPVLPDNRQKVLEKEILALNPAQEMQAAMIRLLREDDARMMLAEVEALEKHALGLITHRPDMDAPPKRAAIDRLARDIQAALAENDAAMLGMLRRISPLERDNRLWRQIMRVVVQAHAVIVPTGDGVILGELLGEPVRDVGRIRTEEQLMAIAGLPEARAQLAGEVGGEFFRLVDVDAAYAEAAELGIAREVVGGLQAEGVDARPVAELVVELFAMPDRQLA